MTSGGASHFTDIEIATFRGSVGVEAANLPGATDFDGVGDSFEGLRLIDFDEIVDRNEELRLLTADHALTIYANSTETADGWIRGIMEISASPARTTISGGIGTGGITGDVVGNRASDDTIDLLGRPLLASAGAPFSDGASGVGGGGSEGHDSVQIREPPAEFARFHPRDELFLNGVFESWNIDDAGIHAEIVGQHVYGVISDE